MNEILEFLTQHGALVLAAAVFAEQVGLPLPALPFLIAAGALVGTGQMSLGVAVVLAVLAAMAGDQVWFELGRRRGRPVLKWLCRISLEPTSCVRRTEDFFARHGVRALLVAKFLPGFSTIAPPLAGIVGLSVPQYLLFNGLGTLLWVGTGLGLGLAFSGAQASRRGAAGTDRPHRTDGRSGGRDGGHRVRRLQSRSSLSCRLSHSACHGQTGDGQACNG